MRNIILGIIIALASLWVGSWGMHTLPEHFHFACWVTSLLSFMGGVVLAMWKLINEVNDSMK